MADTLERKPDDQLDDSLNPANRSLKDAEEDAGSGSSGSSRLSDGSHDSLGIHPEHAEAERASLEKQFGAKSAKGGGSGGWINSTGKGMRNKKNSLTSKLSSSKAKWIALIGGVTGSGTVLALIALLLFASTLKIPNLMQHITEYQFARVTRQVSDTLLSATDESLAIQALDGGPYAALKAKLSNTAAGGKVSEAFGKLDKYRPQKVMANLKSGNGFEIATKQSSILGRTQIVGVTLGDKGFLPIQQGASTKFVPGLSSMIEFKNDATFSKNFAPALKDALKANDVGPIMRGVVSRQIRQKLGISLAAWQLGKFKGKSAAQARIELEQESYKGTKVNPSGDAAATSKLKDAVDEGNSQEAKNVSDPEKLKAIIANGGVDSEVSTTIEKAVSKSTFDSIVGTLNGSYAIALGGCIIYDGSLNRSGPTINAHVTENMRAYALAASSADQTKNGTQDNTDPAGLTAATSAMSDKAGDITDTAPEIRAAGGNPGSASTLAAQGSAMGNFSLINAIPGFNSAIGDFVNNILGPTCSTLTNPFVAGGLAVGIPIAKALAAFFSGGTSLSEEAAEQAVETGISTTTKTITERLTEKVAEKFAGKTLGDYAAKARNIVGDGVKSSAKLAGLTILAKLIVMSRMNSLSTGLEQGDDYVSNVDSGGNLMAGSLEQQELYGRPLTSSEVTQSNAADQKFVYEQNSQKSFTQRYFALTNADSLASKTASSINANLTGTFFQKVVHIFSALLSPSTYSHLFANVVSGKTFAATVPDVSDGNVQFGWSEDEMKLIHSQDNLGADNSYAMINNQQILDASGKEDEIASKYGKCFDGSKQMGDLLADGEIQRNDDGSVISDAGDCSPNNLGANNSTYGDLVLRWRLAHAKSNVVDQATDYQDITPTDVTPGGNNNLTTPTTTPGAIGAIPTGTTIELANKILANPNLTFQTSEDKGYFEHIAQTGHGVYCGAPAIDPALLGVILALSSKYKIVLGVFDDGHNNGCNDGFHPKGMAVDINGVNALDGSAGTGNRIEGNNGQDSTVYVIDKPALHLLEQFYGDAGALLVKLGRGGLGQQQCFEGETPPKVSGMHYFNDGCNHLHMDVGQR